MSHRAHASIIYEIVDVAEEILRSGADLVGERVVLREAGEGGVRVGDGLSVLDVGALDLGEGTAGGDDLGDDGDLGVGVDGLA